MGGFDCASATSQVAKWLLHARGSNTLLCMRTGPSSNFNRVKLHVMDYCIPSHITHFLFTIYSKLPYSNYWQSTCNVHTLVSV